MNLSNLGVAKKPKIGTKKNALSFISGGKPLGETIKESATNNIVGFQRPGTAAVKASAPNMADLIQTISSSVTSNVENIVQNIGSSVKAFGDKIGNLFQAQKDKSEEEGPNKILSEFLKLYERSLDFIKEFSKPKFIGNFREAIRDYQAAFKETSDIVVQMRKFIKKMIDQFLKLKNDMGGMKSAGMGLLGGAGLAGLLGLGGDKKKPPRARTQPRRFKGAKGKAGLALGLLGLLGLGGLGAAAADKFIGDDDKVTATGMTADGLKAPFDVKRFDNILDKWEESMSRMGKSKPEMTQPRSGDTGDSPYKRPGTTPSYSGGAQVPDVSADTEFIAEVQKLSKEVGAAPSELMAMYNAESGLDPSITNKEGATGIFQLMYGGKFGDVRYGKTQDEFRNLSRADQVRAHREYLHDAGFFSKGGSGIADVKMANIAPAYLGSGLDDPIYSAPSAEYEGNKNIDLLFGNKDGVITLREYQSFINQTGGEEGFRQYNQPGVTPAKPTGMTAPQQISQVSQIPGSNSVTVMPMQGETQAPPVQGSPPPMAPQEGLNNVNFNITAENPDNFLTLYSKMTYNIVD